MTRATLDEYMEREPILLTSHIDEERITVSSEGTSFINTRLIPKIDTQKIKSKYERYKALAKGREEHRNRIARYASQVEQLELWYDFTYENYVRDFHTLAFLWKAKVDSGLRIGCNDDLMYKNVLIPLDTQLQDYHSYGSTLSNATYLDMKLDDYIEELESSTSWRMEEQK